MNTTANPLALLRSLIVYGICVPLAIFVGYLLTNPLDYGTFFWIGLVVAILIFPVLMKWHYPLMILCWSLPATLFFVPGRPNLFLVMVAVSLTISVVERILDRNNRFLPASGVQWPLLAFLLVVVITAKLTGGFGLRSMGSEVYGGKKYVFLIVGILSFFALIARPIPKKHANLYITLFFAGGFFNFIQDLYAYTPGPLQFIYWIFPPSSNAMDAMGNMQVVWGETRLSGIPAAAGAVVYWMLARHGFRECFLTNKLWRPLLLGIMFILVCLGGFRSSIISLACVLGLLFYFEKLHRSGLMLVVVMAGIMGTALLVPLARHLPFTFQRALAFLPLDISSDARLDAEASTEWRLEMWQAVLPEVPNYLLRGKGFSFSSQTFSESMGPNATFRTIIDASQDPLALSNDFHSGPLSLVIPFGIWGVLAWLWYWGAGFFVVWRNYRYGDPALKHINRFLFAWFIASCFFFILVFGSVVEDVAHFAALIGLSIAINHGVMRRPPLPQKMPAALQPQAGGHPAFPARPALPALGQ